MIKLILKICRCRQKHSQIKKEINLKKIIFVYLILMPNILNASNVKDSEVVFLMSVMHNLKINTEYCRSKHTSLNKLSNKSINDINGVIINIKQYFKQKEEFKRLQSLEKLILKRARESNKTYIKNRRFNLKYCIFQLSKATNETFPFKLNDIISRL